MRYPMSVHDISGLARRSAALMRQRLGARGDTLKQTLRQRGRSRPPKIRPAAQDQALADKLADPQRRGLRGDNARRYPKGRRVVNHLAPLGAADRRWRLFLSIAASMSFAFLVTVAGVIAVLRWRGYL